MRLGFRTRRPAWRRTGRPKCPGSTGRACPCRWDRRARRWGRSRRSVLPHRAPDHQMMAAPRMIAAVASGGLERAAEVGLRKCCDVLRNAQFLSRRVECRDRLAYLRIERVVRLELACVGIESPQRTEENLPVHAEIARDLHDLRYLLQLRTERGSWKLGLE